MVGKERWADLKNRNEDKVITSIRTRIEEIFSEISNGSPECPFIVKKIIVKSGHPVDLIIHYSEKKDCDMVVMGSRGHGTLSETMLGNTTRRVLRRCTKSVLVVRLPDSV